MGGHAEGARAAETALATLLVPFGRRRIRFSNPLGFLHLSLGRAHEEVVEVRDRLVGRKLGCAPHAPGNVFGARRRGLRAHVGDRPHLSIGGRHQVLERTRDHSHVEVLLREGLITEAESPRSPRCVTYVECCLGGDAALPEMSISTRRRLKSGDVLFLCTDGLWANLKVQDFVRFAQTAGSKPLHAILFDRISEHRRLQPLRLTVTTPAPRRCAGVQHEHQTQRSGATMNCGRCLSSAASRNMPRVRFWCHLALPASCALPALRTVFRHFCAARARVWVTAEYGMLPRGYPHSFCARRRVAKQPGRTQETQRLIGRALPALDELKGLGERTVTTDCHVLQADGGTRTAAITGGFVALADAVDTLLKRRALQRESVARTSGRRFGGNLSRHAGPRSGLCGGFRMPETDMNVVMNSGGAFVEVQGTAEGHAFRRHEL